jgi:hypothetical protein
MGRRGRGFPIARRKLIGSKFFAGAGPGPQTDGLGEVYARPSSKSRGLGAPRSEVRSGSFAAMEELAELIDRGGRYAHELGVGAHMIDTGHPHQGGGDSWRGAHKL